MRQRRELSERYDAPAEGCWLWLGPKDKRGYGRHYGVLAHRAVYEAHRGAIPSGLELDHLCRRPSCVNPDHLEAVTHAVNVRRGICGQVNASRQLSLTACKRGHAFTPENTGRDHRGHRVCRECMRQHHRSYYANDRERQRAIARGKARQRRATERGATQ